MRLLVLVTEYLFDCITFAHGHKIGVSQCRPVQGAQHFFDNLGILVPWC